VFHTYAISLPSEFATVSSACTSHREFPKLNRRRETAKAAGLRGRCSAFLLALACCLPVLTSSASGTLRALPHSVGFLALSGAAPGPYPAVDTFSGSGALSANWTNTTSAGHGYVSLAQSAGTVAPSVSGQRGLATYTGISFTTDQYAQARYVAHSSAAGSTGVCVRMNAAGSGVCYLADWGQIYSLAKGARSYPIAGGCPVPASGDTIQLLVVGTTYTCADVTTGVSASATDATYSTGNPAILVDQRRSTVYALAQFQADCSPSCGDGSSPAPPPPPATTTYPAVDTFSGSGALSANWTNTTSADQGYVSLAQSAGTVASSVSGQQGLATYTGMSFTNDQYAQAKFVAHSSAAGSTGVCVRMNAAGGGVCYLADWGLIYSLANGAGTYAIAGGCPVPASGDTIQLLVVGTIYTCADVTTGVSTSATDTTYSTGNPAILVDQRGSTVYALAQFQADCSPSCGGGSSSPASSPQLTVSATTLSFGSVTVNTAATQTLTLTSTGTSPVTVNSAAITGAGFTIVAQSFPVTLNPTQSVTLQVKFDPTATGTASGQITISSNSTTGGKALVALGGTGTAGNPQLTISAGSVSFGSVAVNTTTTQSLTLTSTGSTPVTVNSATIAGAGFTIVGGGFPVTLNPTQTLTLQLQFVPTTAGALTGQITISSNSTSGSTAVVALSGTGTAVAHEVDLSWDAPASSPDPVAGYNIYRATGTGSLVLINSSPDSAVVYVDSTVVSGATYSYVVKSVDSGGVESVASNEITVTIP
jgi:Abnormal spindle-like microcephaly-assoc'd, ASPM-SPD-2-Hydin